MTKTHPHREDTRADNAGVAAPEFASSLHALLEVTRAVRSGDDVGSVLSTIAQGVAQTLGFQTVVLNVYRPEWDDFYVATVHGSEAVRGALLGSIYDWDSWKPLLHPSFLRAGAYFIPNDAFDWSQDTGSRFVPTGRAACRGTRRMASERRAVRPAGAFRRPDCRDHVLRGPAERPAPE